MKCCSLLSSLRCFCQRFNLPYIDTIITQTTVTIIILTAIFLEQLRIKYNILFYFVPLLTFLLICIYTSVSGTCV